MALSNLLCPQPDRANAFVAKCRNEGFTPSDTVFLAQQRAMFERGSLRGIRVGPSMLMDSMHGASNEMAKRLLAIKTPLELEDYRRNWLVYWGGGACKDPTEDQARLLLRFVYKDSMSDRVDTWIDTSRAPNDLDSWDVALRTVGELTTRMTVQRDPPIEPVPLKRAMKQLGFHTLTWNKWLYPTPKDEAELGGALVAFNEGLQLQTGLTGPLLGLGGMVRLHLDDDTLLDHGGVFSNSLKSRQTTNGKNAFGITQIRLPSYLGLYTLAHEWMHGFDLLMGDAHQHVMNSQTKGSIGEETVGKFSDPVVHYEDEQRIAIESALSHMKLHQNRISHNPDALWEAFHTQVEAGTPNGGWKTWYDTTTSVCHKNDAVRSLATAGAFLTGEFKGSISDAWLSIKPDTYLESPEERLAYAFERACSFTKHLPSSAGDESWWVRSCSGSEQRAAHAVLTDFFQHPDIQQKWAALQSPHYESPLLDAVAARRLTKRRVDTPSSKVAL